MQKLFTVLSLFIFLFGFSFLSFAQDAEEMKVWQEYMTPGSMHEWMQSSSGDWTYNSKFWMAPDTDPMESSGTMHSEMLLGGRYMQQKHTGDMMGMPFEGINTVAYDNAKQLFISTWIDNMGTGIMVAEGKFNEAEKTMNLSGNYFDPMTKTEKGFREVIKIVSDKEHLMEMYMVDGDKEFKNMEIVFTKQ